MLLLVIGPTSVSRGTNPSVGLPAAFLDAARRKILRGWDQPLYHSSVMHAGDELEAQLRELEESHLRPEVRSSPEALRSLLADDFVEIGSSGRIWNREQIIEALSGQAAFTASIEQLAVKSLAPGVALTTYRLVITSGSGRTTLRSSIWVYRDGRWRLLFHQGTPESGPGKDW